MNKKKVEELEIETLDKLETPIAEEVSEENKIEEAQKNETPIAEYILEVDIYFQDKYDKTKFYDVGDILTINDEKRVKDIVKRGLAHIKK